MNAGVSDFVKTLVYLSALSSLLSLCLVWLLREWLSECLRSSVKHEYEVELAKLKSGQDAELEIHKARSQTENAAVIERLKAELRIAAVERQIRFSKLHEEVAECTVEIWRKLKETMGAVGRYTSMLETPSMGTKEERRNKMAHAMEEFQEYVNENSVFFVQRVERKNQWAFYLPT